MKKLLPLIVFLLISTVLFAQVSKTVECTAGGLETLLTSTEKTTITNLSISGRMNAMDFKTIREKMYNLVVLDISSITIDPCNIIGCENIANELPEKSFYNYYSLQLDSILLPQTITSIGQSAFSGCRKIRSIAIPTTVDSIGASAFRDCAGLKSIQLPEQLASIEDYTFINCSSITSIDLPSSILAIKKYAFSGCRNLLSVNIPNVKIIEENAFEYCNNLNSINSPSITSIGKHAFDFCGRLKNIVLPFSLTTLSEGAFEFCASIKTIDLPNSLTSLPDNIFSGCDSLSSINIPNSITSIGSNAFSCCKQLINITIPESITTIKNNTFVGCAKLETITLPSTLTSIGDNAFTSCYSLVSIIIPPQVKSIGSYAFSGCTKLSTITIPASATTLGNGILSYCQGLTSISLPPSIATIPYEMFSNCSKLGSIYIPNSVTSIGSNAFFNCTTLESINTSTSLTTIGDRAFYCCYKLKQIDIPKTVTSIGSYAFESCILLAAPNLPESIKEIKMGTFECCKFSSIILPKSLISIGSNSFANSGLTSIIIPESVKTIEESAFLNCDYLASVVLPSTLTSIPDYIFNGCDRLSTINLPPTLTSIGRESFSSCYRLKTISIPASVVTFGNNAFYSGVLESFYEYRQIPPDLSLSRGDMFRYQPVETCKLYVPFGSSKYYRNSTSWKGFKNIIEMPGFYLTTAIDSFGATEGTLSTNIISNVAWKAKSDQSWLTITPESGSADKTLTLKAEENPTQKSRTAIVTFSSEGIASQTIGIKQDGRNSFVNISLSASHIKLEAAENSSSTVTVSSNSLWNASSDQTWLTVYPDSAITGSRVLTLTANENITSSSRIATVTISGIGVSPKTITVTQKSKSEPSYLNLGTTTINLKDKVNLTSKVIISTNCKWSASSDQSWLTFNPITAIDGDSVLTISATENPTAYSRHGYITISGGAIRKSILISQEAASPYVTISNSEVTLSKDAGSKDSVDITTNASSISLNSNQSWLTATVIGANKITITASENTTYSTRKGIITVNPYTDYAKTIVVSQKGIEISKTISVTSGTLSSLLTSQEESSITDLKLSGTIDARDFKTMRDSMPLLEDIDLSETKITSYTGPLGMNEYINTYLADVVPFYALCNKSKLVSVQLPSSVIKIDTRAFYDCPYLSSINFTDSMTIIGDEAFSGCSSLRDIKLTSSIQTLGNSSFSNCGITSLQLPASVAKINDYCFSNCKNITSVEIPFTEKVLGKGVFSNCTGLRSVQLSENLAIIPEEIFLGCTSLASVIIPNSVHTIETKAFSECKNLTSILIPNSVKIIGECVFSYCYKLSEIRIPNSVENMGIYVFYECRALTKVVLSPSISTIGDCSFENCSLLTSVTIPTSVTFPLQILNIGSCAFSNCYNLKEFTIPSTVETIGSAAFYQSGLTSIVIPPSVINLGQRAFKYCHSLTSVELSPNQSKISTYTFSESNLTAITISPSVKIIDRMAFYNCEKLAKVIISEGVLEILHGAFWSCNSLKSISIPSTINRIEPYAFEDAIILNDVFVYSKIPLDLSKTGFIFNNSNTANATLHVPLGSKNAYQQAFQWKEFKNIVEIPIEVSTSHVSIDGIKGGSEIINVTSDTTWSVSCDQTWLTVLPVGNASGNGTISFTAGINPTSIPRTAEVKVTSTDTDTSIIKVTQSGGLSEFSLSKQMVNLRSKTFNYDLIDVKTSGSWTVSQDQPWLDIFVDTINSGDGTITIVALPNTNKIPRTSIITVTANGTVTKNITVTQEASPVINYDLTISDTSITTSQNSCFNALETITIAGDGKNVFLQTGSSVELIAGQSIHFLPGFHAQEGSFTYAHITPDSTFCGGSEGSIVQNTETEKSSELNSILKGEQVFDNEKSVKVYPNPNNGDFTLEFENLNSGAEIRIFNSIGATIYRSMIMEQDQQKINLTEIKKGLYFVKIMDGKEQMVKKMVVE